MTQQTFEIVCCLRLGDTNAYTHLIPLSKNPCISKIWVIRHESIHCANVPKTEFIIIPSKYKWIRFIKMFFWCLRKAHRKEVKAFVSFNPFPYGVFSYLAARLFRKKIHFGLIGSDWNHYAKGFGRKFLIPLLKKADFITAPGRTFKEELIEHGFRDEKVRVLPHSIDLEKYPVSDNKAPCYTCIYIGRLIRLKRVDRIIKAFSMAAKTCPQAKLCIVGEGPLRKELEEYTESLGLGESVSFMGYQQNIYRYLSDSRSLIIASEHEGFPLTIIEAMCTGVIPVSTPVGSVPEHINHLENGILYENEEELSRWIVEIQKNSEVVETVRDNLIKNREQFSHDTPANIWSQWLKQID